MDLDLLKKLVRLANHNSNEHEANAAARRVCRLLEESKFTVSPSSSIPIKPIKHQVNVTPFKREDYPKDEKDYDDRINKMYEDLLKDIPKKS